MVKLYKGIENQPIFLVLNEIEVGQETSGISKSVLQKISNNLKTFGCNFSLPIVCITDEEDKYHLLTGLPIYEAALMAGIDRIWVFLIAANQPDAEKFIEQALLQSKLNDRVIEPEHMKDFLEFLNNTKSDLTQIPGVKDGYAKLILGKRPYTSQEDMQKKLGAKRSLNWLKAHKQKNS
ncbi:hypothetical protein [Cylindrospermum sp. FACHB-282]|uniref:hypothetical protein n=1 Tax=Cylindrospermum sp. FACHB-282 TaxID=2692794 RepID=UPI0016886D1A|nr:hypothetical protein [Cylindrospermum sp. FACHB-282]MBD2388582.1 hypothetical protein [Cylindrospermum sp. FACHB-282]